MTRLVFSCEIGQREYVPRLWLALKLAKKFGVESIVGHKFSIKEVVRSHPYLGGGDVFFHKDANDDSIKYFSEAKSRGMFTAATDEEYLNWEEFADSSHFVSPKAVPVVDVCFSSSLYTFNAALLAGFRPLQAGNLRIGFAAELAKAMNVNIKKTYDVCINSPTGTFFSIIPLISHLEISARLSGGGFIPAYNKLIPQFRYEEAVTKKIFDLVKLFLVENKKVVIRSHPAESPLLWSKFAEELGVSWDGGKLNSILRALTSREVIGFDCTTLLECLYLDVPFRNLSEGDGGHSKTIAGRNLRGDYTSRTRLAAARSALSGVLFSDSIFDHWVSGLEGLGVNLSPPKISFDPPPFHTKMSADVLRRRGEISEPIFRSVSTLLGISESEVSVRCVSPDLFLVRPG